MSDSQRPTPETDALHTKQGLTHASYRDFARKLERDRDEAREQLEDMQELITRTKAILQQVDLPDEPLDVQAQRMVNQHDWQLGIARGQAKQIEQANHTVRAMREAIKEAHDAIQFLSQAAAGGMQPANAKMDAIRQGPRQTPTLHQTMNLTDEEIRIKIAEAMGLKFVYAGHIKMPKAQETWPDHWQDTRYKRSRVDGSIVGTPVALPNYPLDLNACASFEATLTKSERTRYADILCDMCYNGEPAPNVEQVISATARQRCLAYLKTKGILP